ncbi:MAG: NaeI family type II restriction endonuclease [Pseudonocardiales bacterium]
MQGRIIRRAVVATVGQQDDFMKRVRGNGGSRTHLRAEGILVLGHQDNDPKVAEAPGLPKTKKGEFVSARVVRVEQKGDRRVAEIAGVLWALAVEGEPVVPAPDVPRKRTRKHGGDVD